MTKRVLVLGGSGALGRVIVRELRAAGAHVFASYLTREIAPAERLVPFRVDVADGPALHAAIRACGPVDALVHCAAVPSTNTPHKFESMHEVDLDGFDRLMAINVKSALVAVRAVEMTVGNVVFIGSIDGVKGVPAPAPYAASKAALCGLATALAKELGPRGTLVNVVAPGVLESGLSSLLPDKLRNEYLKHCARKRLGKHEEVASLVTFLALENTYLDARTLTVDGGL